MARHPHRRDFLRGLAASTAVVTMSPRALLARARQQAPGDRLNIGVIGVAHRGEDNLNGVQGENIVALCDIDDLLLGRAAERFPAARTYNDFRKLIDHPGLDAVVISTADHTHAPAAAAALRAGKHVYCEKPLSHTVHEARTLADLARQTGLATQMGTQIHATDNYRRVVELVQSGAIGPVSEVHVWCRKSWSGGDRPTDTPPVPPNLHWDLWQGPAAERPYHPTYLPANWRGWWEYGNGTLGDMGCHLIDLAFWSLDLKHPDTVQAEGPPVHPEAAPPWLTVYYNFPARGDRPPVALTWYHGDRVPEPIAGTPARDWGIGLLFVGQKGQLLADYDRRILLPEDQFRDFMPPTPSIAPSIGHHAEWIAACKSGQPALCRFDYSGPLTECVLLGNVAYRSGCLVVWKPEQLSTGCAEGDSYLRRPYRAGWTL